jgi:aspartokinase
VLALVVCVFSAGVLLFVRARLNRALDQQIGEDLATVERVYGEETGDLGELGEVWIEEGRAIVAIVGIGLRKTPGLAGRVFNAVWPANVEIISQGASAINMTFVVREEEGPDVVRRLHQEFFGSC